MYNIEEYTRIIRERLSDYRFYHSLCVAESAKALAKRFGADEHKAEVAGLLHDVCKEEDFDKQEEYIKAAGWELTPLEAEMKKFHHQLSGSAYCKTVLGIDDEEILDAIKYHTTARAEMTLMDEIVYLADFISADRDYDDVDKMRAKVEKGLIPGLIYAMKYTIKSCLKKKSKLHPMTIDAYNWVIQLKKDSD